MTLPGTSDTPSTEVAHASSFVNPLTGEALTLDSPTPDLAHALLAIREVESELRELKRAITRVVLGRQDQSASWSQRLDGLKITGQSPQPSEKKGGWVHANGATRQTRTGAQADVYVASEKALMVKQELMCV